MKNRVSTFGFGLIEILIAVFIVSFGVVAIGVLQTNIISSSSQNHGRQLAIEIARSRLETFREITQQYLDGSSADDMDNINDMFTWINSQKLSNELASVNIAILPLLSDSNQKYDYCINEDGVIDGSKIVFSTTVSWPAAISDDGCTAGENSVFLKSDIAFKDPTISDKPKDIDPTFVEAPTGRARIGDGELTDEDKANLKFKNVDGTKIYGDASDVGDDYVDLLLANGEDIVLTLEDACVITSDVLDDGSTIGDDFANEYDCTDFVRITGRIYFDDALIINDVDQDNLNANSFYVLASDAAYCSRYYGAGDGLVNIDENTTTKVSGLPKPLVDLPEGETDYTAGLHYFDYTCYIGGGWHGNIGLVLVNSDYKGSWSACVGDPETLGNDSVEFAFKRTYRGMVWKHDGDGVPNEDEYSKIKYYSWGIADASYIGGDIQYNHDFLVVASSEKCADSSIMDPNVFATNADDFFCLNEVTDNASGLVDPSLSQGNYDYINDKDFSSFKGDRTNLDQRNLDPDRDGKYTNPNNIGYYTDCPYDPTNAPYYIHSGEGQLILSSLTTSLSSSDLIDSFFLRTSQGDNCTVSVANESYSSGYVYNYSCFLWDFGKEGTGQNAGKILEAGFVGTLDVYDYSDQDNYEISCNNLSSFDFTANNSESYGWADKNILCDLTVSGANSSKYVANDDGYDILNNTTYSLKVITATDGEIITVGSGNNASSFSYEGILNNDTYDNVALNNGNWNTFVTKLEFTGLNNQSSFDGVDTLTYKRNVTGTQSKSQTIQYTVTDKDGNKVTGNIVFRVID